MISLKFGMFATRSGVKIFNFYFKKKKTGLWVTQRQIGKNRGGVFKIPMEDTGGAEYDLK